VDRIEDGETILRLPNLLHSDVHLCSYRCIAASSSGVWSRQMMAFDREESVISHCASAGRDFASILPVNAGNCGE
jgi:hypothetical protein